jgi:hypothetical protein
LGAISIAEGTEEPEHQLLEGFQLLDAIGDLLFWGGFRLLGSF